MEYQQYKMLHFIGLALTFMGLAGVLAHRAANGESVGGRLLFTLTHGLGLILLLVSGFGLAAKLGFTHEFPIWLIGLVVVWILTGATLMLAKRFSRYSLLIVIWMTALIGIGSWLAVLKPFSE